MIFLKLLNFCNSLDKNNNSPLYHYLYICVQKVNHN